MSVIEKIDPIGFALENFDPIGRWRDSYGRNNPIDPSGELPGGRAFDGIVGLKSILMDQQHQFAKAFVEKTLAYAVGRRMEAIDRPDVDRILDETRDDEYPMRDIIENVVTSRAFLSR